MWGVYGDDSHMQGGYGDDSQVIGGYGDGSKVMQSVIMSMIEDDAEAAVAESSPVIEKDDKKIIEENGNKIKK